MTEEQYSKPEINEHIKGIRHFFGIALIVVGVIIAIWVIINVYKIVTNPQQLEIFKHIIPNSPEMRELNIDGKKVILPEGIFIFLSYGIGWFLLLIAASIGTTFIKGGVDLLMSSFVRLEMKISKEMEKLKRKMDETKASITKKIDSE